VLKMALWWQVKQLRLYQKLKGWNFSWAGESPWAKLALHHPGSSKHQAEEAHRAQRPPTPECVQRLAYATVCRSPREWECLVRETTQIDFVLR
jgi:hypothetical protein